MNDEPSSLLPSDSSNDTSKHDDSSEKEEDDLENKWFAVSSFFNKKLIKNKEDPNNMFCDVFACFASILENISRFSEEKEDKQIKSIVKTIASSSKSKDNVESSKEDIAILIKGNPSKGGTSKKNGNVTYKAFIS